MQEVNTEIYLKNKKIKKEYGRNRYHMSKEEKTKTKIKRISKKLL